MSLRLLGPLHDLSARGDLFRRYCFLFLKLGIPFTIKVVAEEESKITADENTDSLSPYITDIDPSAKTVISFLSLDKPYTSLTENLDARKVLFFYAHSHCVLDKEHCDNLALYDSIWCANDFSYSVLNGSDIISKDKKIILGVPVNSEDKLARVKLNLPSPKPITSETFIFYSIGRFTERNNFRALLEAYWSSFSIDDDVALVLKTYMDNHSSQELEYIHSFIDFCMQEGGYKKTPNLLVLHDSYPRKIMLGIHKLGHCYVDPKRADYLGLNKSDAALFGNFIIQPELSPRFKDEFSRVYTYKTSLRPVFSERKSYFYPKQVWMDANVDSLELAMTRVYHRFRQEKIAKSDSYYINRNTEEAVKQKLLTLL